MAQFYVDDSIHDDAGFIIGACVYSKNDLSDEISDILLKSGYNPHTTEFKSRTSFKSEPQMAAVRTALRELFRDNCKFGIVVIPRNERQNLGLECLNAISGFISLNALNEPIDIYFDQGLFSSSIYINQAERVSVMSNCKLHFEQDSIIIKGLQLADMAAHTSAIILKERMGLVNKIVKAGENSGYNPDTDIELGFEMWASIRYNLFTEKNKKICNDPIADYTYMVEPFGLFVSNTCDEKFSRFARDVFSEVYLGCIH